MKIKNYVLLSLSAGLLVLFGCRKDQEASLAQPQPLMLRPINDTVQFDGAVLEQMQLFYYQNQMLNYVNDFGRATGSSYQNGILVTKDIAALSANEHIKTYFLRFPDGDIDTLLVDYAALSDEDARLDECFCNKPLKQFLINGKVPQQDTLKPDGKPVYLLYK